MGRENETKRVFGDNPIVRPRPAERMNTFEKLTSLDQIRVQRDTAKIKTTPEAIVRNHREMMRRMAPGEREDFVIYGRPATQSGRSLKRNLIRGADIVIAAACMTAVAACVGYVAITFVIPFLRMMVLG